MNLVKTAAEYSPISIPDAYPIKVVRRTVFGDDIFTIRVKTVNNSDEEFIFKVKNLGELKQKLRKNLKLEEPIRFFFCKK